MKIERLKSSKENFYIDVYYQSFGILWSYDKIKKNKFLNVFRLLKIPKQNRLLEWNAASSFISFGFLLEDYCNSSCVIDCDEEEIKCVNETITNNLLTNRVSSHLGQNLDVLSLNEKWNCAISYMPFIYDEETFNKVYLMEIDHDYNKGVTDLKSRIFDKDKKNINKFFERNKLSLEKNGFILLALNNNTSKPKDFANIAEYHGFKMLFNYGVKKNKTNTIDFHNDYLISFIREEDDVPQWLIDFNTKSPGVFKTEIDLS